jgi:hypothetical protein
MLVLDVIRAQNDTQQVSLGWIRNGPSGSPCSSESGTFNDSSSSDLKNSRKSTSCASHPTCEPAISRKKTNTIIFTADNRATPFPNYTKWSNQGRSHDPGERPRPAGGPGHESPPAGRMGRVRVPAEHSRDQNRNIKPPHITRKPNLKLIEA